MDVVAGMVSGDAVGLALRCKPCGVMVIAGCFSSLIRVFCIVVSVYIVMQIEGYSYF